MVEANENNSSNFNSLTGLEPQVESLSIQEQSSVGEDVIERLQNIGLSSELGRVAEPVRSSNQLIEPTRNLIVENLVQRRNFLPNSLQICCAYCHRRTLLQRSTNRANDLRIYELTRRLNIIRREFQYRRIRNRLDAIDRSLELELLRAREQCCRRNVCRRRDRRRQLFNDRRGSAFERFRNVSFSDHSESNYSDSNHSNSGSESHPFAHIF
ncbi:UNVERIFIED_CONTAM: hypothetical protein RMT77_018045 [Armadillidium vulgare]